MSKYSEQQRRKVIARAIEAVQARIKGSTEVSLGEGYARQTLILSEGGYCNRFVRQVFETTLGLKPFAWRFGALRACLTLAKLEPYRIPLKDRRPGDILGFPGDPGHICLYLGRDADPAKELVAENTSSARRGYPLAAGTKLTRYSTLRNRVIGCYRLFE
jgi:hypothetical protein